MSPNPDVDDNPFKAIAEALCRFDTTDLLAAVSGLQLMPQNADRYVRLEALTHITAATAPQPDKPRVNSETLALISNSWPFDQSGVATAEDPFENLFTESFTFYEGAHTVFPGITENPAYILKQLSIGLFRHPEGFSPYQLKRDASSLIQGILNLSDEISRRVGLSRGMPPISMPDSDVFVPDDQILDWLKRAVTFKPSGLARLLTDSRLNPGTLNCLVTRRGDFDVAGYELGNTQLLLKKPIVLTDQEYIVALPSALLPAARHHVVLLAKKLGATNKIADRFNLAVWSNVISSLKSLGNNLIDTVPPTLPHGSLWRDGFFDLDEDKLIYALLITDPLTNYDDNDVFGTWQEDDLADRVLKRFQQIEDTVLSGDHAPNELLLLLVVQGVGRSFGLPIGHQTTSRLLYLTAASLETISWAESHDPLLLWKYAGAASKIRQTALVMTTNDLDEFHFYRKRHYDYYASDTARPNFIAIMPGGAGDLRTEVLAKRDWHGVPGFVRGTVVEVTTVHDTVQIPLYAAPDLLDHGHIYILVEGLPIRIWVGNRDFRNDAEARLVRTYMQFIDAISYWLWQFTPSLKAPLASLPLHYPHIVVEISLKDATAWDEHRELETPDSDPWEVITDAEAAIVRVVLNSHVHVFSRLSGPENQGERDLMKSVLAGFSPLLERVGEPGLSSDEIHAIVETHSYPSNKKMILTLDLIARPDLDPRDLPRLRDKYEADVSQLLDDLGLHLTQVEGLATGPIPDTERTALINNKIVPFLFEHFKKVIASLNPHKLLEWLVAQNESVVRESVSFGLTLPAHLACFSSDAEMIQRLTDELPQRNVLGTAGRFLLEYVVTQPPRGYRPISMSVYDELIALAVKIIDYGSESDLIYFNLADHKFSILPSGRLGVDRSVYTLAQDAFKSANAEGELTRAKSFFSRNWRESETVDESRAFFAKLDAAAEKEFGHTLTELLTFLIEVSNIGVQTHPTVGTALLTDLTSQLVERLRWPTQNVSSVLNQFSLTPRAQFLSPPAPHRKEDTFPWRFNRSLSYLRRPLLHRRRQGVIEVLWGNRNVYSARRYLANLCTEGRLRARTEEMRGVLAEINDRKGKDFNDRVADYFLSPGNIVKRRVKKIGQLRLTGPTGDLGDLDVLVAMPARRLLRIIECKNLAGARTPFEMSNEVDELFRGSNHTKSEIEKLHNRVSWVTGHLSEVLAWLGISVTDDWTVAPLIVVDHELFTPYLEHSEIPVVALHQLPAFLAS
ncbi:MAG: hypothetical protein QOH96_1891 [Blastocatellia bacterium]|nr:hypothetical protein [Blastocatellia bacterium]